MAVKVKIGTGILSETVGGIFDIASASVTAFGRISASSIGAFGGIASSAIAAGGSIISAAMASKKDSGDSAAGETQVVVVNGSASGSSKRPTTQTTAVSKPTVSNTMGVNQLLAIMVDQLSSIQSTLSGQIVAENRLAKSEEMASKEADIEGKTRFSERIKDTYGSTKGKVKRGGSLIAGALVAAGVLASIGNIKWDDILKIADSAKQLVAGIKETIMGSMDKIVLLGGLISLMYSGLPGLILSIVRTAFPFLVSFAKFGLTELLKFIAPRLVPLLALGAAAATTGAMLAGISTIADTYYEDVVNTVKSQPTLKKYGITLVKPGVWRVPPGKEYATEQLPSPYKEIVAAYFPADGQRYGGGQKKLQQEFTKNISDGMYIMDPKTKELKLAGVPTPGRTDYGDANAAPDAAISAPSSKLESPLVATPPPATQTSSMGSSTADTVSSMSQENNNTMNLGLPSTPAAVGEAPSVTPGSGTIGNKASSTLDGPLDPTFTNPKIGEYFQYFDKAA